MDHMVDLTSVTGKTQNRTDFFSILRCASSQAWALQWPWSSREGSRGDFWAAARVTYHTCGWEGRFSGSYSLASVFKCPCSMCVQSNRSLGDNLGSLADIVIGELSEFKDKILRTICKWCGVSPVTISPSSLCSLSSVCTLLEKTTIYTTLVGILNAKKFDLGEEVICGII